MSKTARIKQIAGRLLVLHILYIVLGLLSVLFMFGLSIILLSEHQWCKYPNPKPFYHEASLAVCFIFKENIKLCHISTSLTIFD